MFLKRQRIYEMSRPQESKGVDFNRKLTIEDKSKYYENTGRHCFNLYFSLLENSIIVKR